MDITAEQKAYWKQNTARGPFNIWLDGQTKNSAGGLDLDALYEVAERFGLKGLRERYSHLNPGQQRMNVGNRLRKIVPADAYTEAKEVETRPALIRDASVRQLLRIHADVLSELRDREIVRTGNSPLGDYAELLFATAFSWELANNSSAGHDAVDRDGRRYQIKARRVTSRNKSRQLSAIRKLPEATFDYLACVLFDENYAILKAIIIPHMLVTRIVKRTEHTNSWRLMLTDNVWNLDGVRDVTSELREAADTI
jgi:hypothetical protein